ncbi:MAG: glycosyltransferase family 2 protein [Candidatus Levyibacteriota bacterium]
MNNKSLCFLVFAYKKVDLTTACIDSIYRYEPDAQVLFLDNGSQDGSYETIVKRYASFSAFTHYVLEKNLGHAGGLNFLLKKYLSMPSLSDIFVVMDNDAELLGSVSQKVENLFSSNKIGVIGKTGYFFIPDKSGFRLEALDKASDPPTTVDTIATYFAAFRREVLHAGLIDKAFEEYLYGGDDFDLCLKIKQDGWDILFDPSFPIEHVRRGSSSLLGNDFVEEQIVKTNALLDEKWRKYYPQVLEIEKNKQRVLSYLRREE